MIVDEHETSKKTANTNENDGKRFRLKTIENHVLKFSFQSAGSLGCRSDKYSMINSKVNTVHTMYTSVSAA